MSNPALTAVTPAGRWKVCVYGVGAIGGFIGTRLALAGECDVSAVARGATLAALRSRWTGRWMTR